MTYATSDNYEILLASCLPSDRWTSLQIYADHVARTLTSSSHPLVATRCTPFGATLRTKYLRALVRRMVYPLQIRTRLARRPRQTLLHVLDQFYAYLIPPHRPSAITCHDLAEYYISDLAPAQLRRWKRRVQYIRNADVVFTDSRHTAKDVRRLLDVASDRIIVNPLGVDPAFRRLPNDHRCSDTVRRLVELAADHVLVLHVGGANKRKNIPALLAAIAELRSRKIRVLLVKTGTPILNGPYAPCAKEWGVDQYILDLGHLARNILVEVYNVCSALLMPSTYEGFGFPPLEAQACGLPCVISNATSLPEVGGAAVLYHAPEDVDGLVSGIQRVVEDASCRKSLIAAGYRNAAGYTWDAHADRLIEGYKRVLQGHLSNV